MGSLCFPDGAAAAAAQVAHGQNGQGNHGQRDNEVEHDLPKRIGQCVLLGGQEQVAEVSEIITDEEAAFPTVNAMFREKDGHAGDASRNHYGKIERQRRLTHRQSILRDHASETDHGEHVVDVGADNVADGQFPFAAESRGERSCDLPQRCSYGNDRKADEPIR